MAGYDGRGTRFPLTIVRGADMAIELTVTSGGSPVNMSAATIALELYAVGSSTVVDTMTAVVSGASSNIITLSFTDAETTALTATKYVYTLWVTRAGDKRPWLAGDVFVGDGTTGQGNGTSTALTVTVDGDVAVAIDVTVVAPDASNVSITDTAGHYTGTNVETALAEIGAGTTLDGRYAPLFVSGYPGLIVTMAYVHREDPTDILEYATARGFDFITYKELVEALVDGTFVLPPKPFLLSIDDEPSEMMTIHDPALAAFNAKATLFVSSGYPDGETMDGGADVYFTAGTSATWANLRTLRDTGRWDFQNHSRTHRSFITISEAERTAEWTYSQARILAELDIVPRVFQHPKDGVSRTTVEEAFAFGFEMVGIGPQGGSSMTYGPANRMVTPLVVNRTRNKLVYWRDAPAGLEIMENAVERFGNRIPDMPLDDNALDVWTVTGGTEDNGTNGVRFDQPDKTGIIDLRSNNTGNVIAITAQFIAMIPNEVILVTYIRQYGVGAGTFRITFKEYSFDRTLLRSTNIESLTGTSGNGVYDAPWTTPADTFFIKIELAIEPASAGLYATFQNPYVGSIR